MDDVDLLPQALRDQSLSTSEMVLPYQEALEAIDILVAANWILLGWEAWLKKPDGSHLHPVMGTVSIEQEAEEVWETYIQRSARLCRETMEKELRHWETTREAAFLRLYFCLTAKALNPDS